MIGDGCLMDYPHLRAYRVEITGNVVEERNYYEKISIFLQKEFNLTPKVFERSYKDGSKGLKLIVNNKRFVYFLKNEYGFTNNECNDLRKSLIIFTNNLIQEFPSIVKESQNSVNILKEYFDKQNMSIYDDSFERYKYETIEMVPLAGCIDDIAPDQDIFLSIGENTLRKKYFLFLEAYLL